MKFLIVDDSRAMQFIIKRSLAKSGYMNNEFQVAEDGVQALGLIEDWQPDIVITDWHMPNMTGFELIKEVKSRELDVKIGLLTTETDSSLIKQAKQAGAIFVLHKPFEDRELQALLMPLLGDSDDAADAFIDTKLKDDVVTHELQLPSIAALNKFARSSSIKNLSVERSSNLTLNYDHLPYVIALFSNEALTLSKAMCILDIRAAAILSYSFEADSEIKVAQLIESKKLDKTRLDNITKIMVALGGLFHDPNNQEHLELKGLHVISKQDGRLDKISLTAKKRRLDLVIKSDMIGEGQIIFMAVAEN